MCAQLTAGLELTDFGLDQFVTGVVALHIAHHQAFTALFSGSQDGVRLSDRDGHRLFHKDVLAGQQGVARDLPLHHKIGGNSDGLDLRVGQQRLVVAVQPGDAVACLYFSAQLLAHFGQRQQRTIRNGDTGWECVPFAP